MRVALTSTDARWGQWTLKKPLRPYGSQGMVDVLNALGQKMEMNSSSRKPWDRTGSRAVDLLEAVHQIKDAQHPALITGLHMPSILVEPLQGQFYVGGSLDEIRKALGDGPLPVQIWEFSTEDEALKAIPEQSQAAWPLEHLTWLAGLYCSEGNHLHEKNDESFRLRRWPNFPQLPHQPQHLKCAAILTKQTATIAQIASVTGSAEQEVIGFLQACQEFGRLERNLKPAAARPAASVPAQTALKAGLLRGILRRL